MQRVPVIHRVAIDQTTAVVELAQPVLKRGLRRRCCRCDATLAQALDHPVKLGARGVDAGWQPDELVEGVPGSKGSPIADADSAQRLQHGVIAGRIHGLAVARSQTELPGNPVKGLRWNRWSFVGHAQVPKLVVFQRRVVECEARQDRPVVVRQALECKFKYVCFKLRGVQGVRFIVILDGTSPPIHELNKRLSLNLIDSVVADVYLRFFCGFVWGEEGGFWVIEPGIQIPWLDGADAGLKSETEEKILPIRYTGTDDRGNLGFHASILYSTACCEARFQVQPHGMVEMTEDSPLMADLPVQVAQRTGPLRQAPARRALGQVVLRAPKDTE